MSAIVGIFHTDGRTAQPGTVRRMLQPLSHRSPDGTAVWHDGPVGLGHGLLRTATPDTTLLTDGELAITADCRLDNRNDLVASLGLDGRSASDAAVILAAYHRWRDECPTHLLGDFAFAIWDGRRRELFCARDHFGVRPFYFHAGRQGFFFASEMKALFAVGVSQGVDEARIAEHIVGIPADSGATLYPAVERLPPRHRLVVSASGRQVLPYWELPAEGAPSRGDAPRAFRELFQQAVASRLAGSGRVGAMLSGGLDSSSIAVVASKLMATSGAGPLPTVSLVFDRHRQFSERDSIEAVLAAGAFEPSFADSNGFVGFAGFDRILDQQDGVFLAPGLAISERVYALAADRGIRILLDGHGGDEVVSHGYGRIHELARSGRWFKVWRESRGVAATYGEPAWRVFSGYAARYGPGRHLARLRRRGRRAPDAGPHDPERPAWLGHVSSELAARTGLAARMAEQMRGEAKAARTERGRHLWLLSTGMVPHAFEVLDRTAAEASIEPRYPFWDKRIVEFCLALPSHEKLQDGWPRLILRRAMEGLLPPPIQWRRDKLDFAPHVTRGMVNDPVVEEVLSDRAGDLGRYVDVPAACQVYRRIVERGEKAEGSDVQTVWRTVTLALWLRQLHARQPVDRHAVAV